MIDFSEVQNSVRELKRQFETDRIDEISFEERLLEMVDLAEDGYYWMYGHKSEQWFRHDGQKWVPDDPSRIISMRSQTVAAGHDDAFKPEELPVNSVWFIVSLGLITVIGVIVYISALVA
jgi:hypothetical protein